MVRGRRGNLATILVIEKYQSLCELYRLVLRQFNHEVIMANTGEAGIQAARLDKPNMIIMDLLLDDMNGNEVVERLTELEILPDTPLIVTAALDEMAAQTITRSILARAVLVKPFNIGVFMSAVQTGLADVADRDAG